MGAVHRGRSRGDGQRPRGIGRGEWRLEPGQTLASVLDDYAEVARHTDELVASLPDLDVSHPLPEAPWFPPGAHRSARRVFLHIIAETPSTPGTPTSCGSPSTARRRWADVRTRRGETQRPSEPVHVRPAASSATRAVLAATGTAPKAVRAAPSAM